MSDETATASPTELTKLPSGTWSVDPDHSKVGFAIRHMRIDLIRGEFTKFEGTLEVGGELSSATAAGSVDVGSIFTNQPQRDEHLRSIDFFDAERYPTISFVSTRIEMVDQDTLRITGELTLHGVRREIVLRAVLRGRDIDPFGNERVGLEVTGEISRSDYDMRFNTALRSGALLVADKVKLVLDISAIKQS
jgi:polyisoprenoid-binding protein YceI